MFLAPAGNPSSLRVGHPDVATEHTDLSPTNSLPHPVVRGGGAAVRQGYEPRATQFGKTVRERGGEYSGWAPQTAHRETKVGNPVRHGGGSVGKVWAPTRRLTRTAQLYLPEATSGCLSSARAGAPVGAKEVYSVPVHPRTTEEITPQDASKHLKNVQLTTQLC